MAQQEMAIAQDLPPQGGFPTTIRYQRYIPSRGPSGAFLFAAAFGIMTYGWYWTIQSNRERMELAREKHWFVHTNTQGQNSPRSNPAS